MSELEDRIDEWHDSPGEGRELHEHLGMTWDEYKRWVSGEE